MVGRFGLVFFHIKPFAGSRRKAVKHFITHKLYHHHAQSHTKTTASSRTKKRQKSTTANFAKFTTLSAPYFSDM